MNLYTLYRHQNPGQHRVDISYTCIAMYNFTVCAHFCLMYAYAWMCVCVCVTILTP